ncbi:MAG: chromophore lyase CpcT/CpeT [Flavobacteriales bacterium]|nr:chromophore lyase CpcT/CpeT [Flavobacteriales bacterium]
MLIRATILCLALLPCSVLAQRTRALEELASTMVGSYTSAAQAVEDTSYFDIELEMVRVWPKRKDGVWLYVEQAAAKRKEKPYRQRVYHLQQVNDSTFTSDILSIKSGDTLFGAYKDPILLERLHMDSLEMIEGCTITLHHRGKTYVGSTEGRRCSNAWGKATYATSEVTIAPGLMVSWDRGYNDADEQVWGAEKGGYRFVRKP